MSQKQSLEKETRAVFHKIHEAHLADDYVTNRHTQIIDPLAMHLPEDFLVGLKCADLGCGSAAHGVVNMLERGAAFVHGMDVDDTFFKSATERLNKHQRFSGRWQLDKGSLKRLPYPDETFDFVLCRGVIHHVENDQQALCEIHRVLKTGGRSYIFVTGKGGIFNRLMKEVLRAEYKENSEFRRIVAEGKLESWLKEQINDLCDQIDREDETSYIAAVAMLENAARLIDNDLILSLIDILEAPKYKEYTLEEWFGMLKQAGFQNYYRFGRRPRYNNIRKIVAPLYENFDHPLAKLLYRDGSINVIVKKD